MCGLDEAGGGQEPCTQCGTGEVPNIDGTACVVCEHGESSPGSCEPDRCEGVSCGANAYCFKGVCVCNRGFEDPDDDGVCTKECRAGWHDPDANGVCTKVCNYDDNDFSAALSLATIEPEPWERGESYYCKNNVVVVKHRVSGEHSNEHCLIRHPARSSVDLLSQGHSHPYFEWDDNLPPSAQITVICHGKRLRTKDDFETYNEIGKTFSEGDKINARNSNRPSYLRVPKPNKILVFRRWPEGCLTCEFIEQEL